MSGWKTISCRCLVLGLTLSELAISLNLTPFQSSCFRCSSQNPRSYLWALFLAHPLHSIGHKVSLTLPAKHRCVSCRNAWERSRMEAQFSSDTCERTRVGERDGSGEPWTGMQTWRRLRWSSSGSGAKVACYRNRILSRMDKIPLCPWALVCH